jgi:16S rRNA (adenine1518-N6/adenine1519-N6)-dimethyltransferase
MKYIPGAQQNNTKKSLGQHWLHDIKILEDIASAAEVKEGDKVLEIGPGLGTLTQVLVDKGSEVTALEFDQDLIPRLNKKFSNCDKVAITKGDIRNFDYTTLPKDFKLVANIPYYLTSNLIRNISETANQPVIAALLIQKEVAERICAKPGKMGILSVSAQFYFDCSLDAVVGAAYFTPPPKVDSQVVVLKRRENKLFNVDEKLFFKLVKAGFSEKRKTLKNSLSSTLGISKDDVDTMLSKASLLTNSRAQELSLEAWHKLYLVYYGT